ncbi:MAG: hypothetical protein PUB22_00365, partial [Clostridiales bacterium]|nr:hypothetical protein [Clostridiales bacterium]
MKKRLKRLLTLFLALSMTLGMVTTPAMGARNEAGTSVEQVTETVDHNHSVSYSSEEKNGELEAEEEVIEPRETEETNPFSYSNFSLERATSYVLESEASDAEIDENDPAIQAAAEELGEMTVTEEDGTQTALTEEQIQNVLGLYSMYQQQWKDNADVLGVQMPFYLQYNDNKEDGLGVLGEMLVLAGVSVEDVRSGNYSYDELTGMIMNFYYGDQLGIEYYGETIRSRRDEALQAVKDSGAKTEYQKLLVLNDWLATVDSFDMSYIMNSGKDVPVMAAEDPQPHEHYQDIYDVMYGVYEPNIRQMFHDQIYDGVKQELETQIRSGVEQEFHDQIFAGIEA